LRLMPFLPFTFADPAPSLAEKILQQGSTFLGQ
jgi:hypothetical protein